MTDASAILREPWPDVGRQRAGASFGIWTFLASELLFFGVLFLGFAVYHSAHPAAFGIASHETNIILGSLNTVILLTSSLTMTIAERAAIDGLRRIALTCLLITAALGIAFIIVKGFEYRDDLRKNLFPGPTFSLQPASTQLFWALYWIITGIHALHLTIGIGVVLTLTLLISRRLVALQTPATEVASLYWHLVDVIWVTVFAVVYLGGRG